MNKLIPAGVWIGLSLAAFAPAAVVVSPVRLEESRSITIVDDKIGHSPDQLKLTLSIKGPEAETAVKYGNLHIDQAIDDRGTILLPPKDRFNKGDKFQEYSNAFFRKNDLEQKETPADPQVEIVLGLPKRAATKIPRLRGWFELAQQGTIKTIEVPDIVTSGSKKIDIPAEAGVNVTTTVKTGDKNSIGIEITGDENAIESIEVLNGSGKKISNGMSSWSFGDGPAHKSLDLESPLDAKMKLVLKIALDRKKTKVVFDLKDIVLP